MRYLAQELIDSLDKLYEEEGDPYQDSDGKRIDQKVEFKIDDETLEKCYNLQDTIYSLNWDDFKIEIENKGLEWRREIDECEDIEGKQQREIYYGQGLEEQGTLEAKDKIETEDVSEKEKLNNILDGCEDFYDRRREEIGEDFPVLESHSTPCAWYSTFHIRSNREWGIHIKENCLLSLGRRIYKWNKATRTPEEACKAAFFYIMCHEMFHYISDCSATVIEVINRNPKLYKDYMSTVFWHDYYNDPQGALEEALANRYVYGRYKFMRINKHFLFTMLKSQYRGYRDFDKYLGGNFRKGRRRLINQVIKTRSKILINDQLPLEQIIDLVDQKSYILQLKVPVWIHRNTGEVEKLIFSN